MITTRPFLLEIGAEELPAKQLMPLATALAENLRAQLLQADLTFGSIETFATPRRLAVRVLNLIQRQPDRNIERRGPALAAAYTASGDPTPACVGFARSCGVSVADLKILPTPKGDVLYFKHQQPGQATTKLLPKLVADAIDRLPIPRPMRWGTHSTLFIRPVHWVVMMYGEELVDAKILGINTSLSSHGHRFMYPDRLEFASPMEYEPALTKIGKVIANFAERQALIRQQLEAVEVDHGKVVIDPDLLNEVTGLVEWPVALVGNFAPRFLGVPAEALISAMKVHQKCFPVMDKEQRLLPHFVTISNIISKNPAQVIAGNERVIRARLSDAEFFYHADLKHSLMHRLETLRGVIFQAELGSLYDKSQRLAKLTQYIGKQLQVDEQLANRAGLLAKTDLVSEMVGEFPELQGTMGYYYALQDKEPEVIAIALKEQYLPKFAGDVLPNSALGCALALADRIDTLVGIFSIQKIPTGDKDPFALRRAALGVLRIMIERKLALNLREILIESLFNYGKNTGNNTLIDQVFDFIMERLKAWYLEQNISAEVIAAVLARQPAKPLDFEHRIKAVQHFIELPAAQSLAAANKRVSNILKGVSKHLTLNPSLLQQVEEVELANLVIQYAKTTEELCRRGEYKSALIELAKLQQPVDRFFDKVLVNTDDEKLRHNRLALLMQLQQLFLQIADISLLSS